MSDIEKVKRLLGEIQLLLQPAELGVENYEREFEQDAIDAYHKSIDMMSLLDKWELSYAALEASRDFMEKEMEFYKREYRLANGIPTLVLKDPEPPAEKPLTLPDVRAGLDRSMWERYGYEAVDDDPEEQARRRAAAKEPPAEERPIEKGRWLVLDSIGKLMTLCCPFCNIKVGEFFPRCPHCGTNMEEE